MADTYIDATAGDGSLKIATVNDGTGDHQRTVIELDSSGTPTKVSIGQQTKSASVPVAIASDQDAVPVTVSSALPAGTNNIGDVDVASLPSSVLAGMSSLPAGTNVIGYVRILRQYSNNTSLVPSASRATGNSSDLSVALYNQVTCFLNITVSPGTSLDVEAKSKDPISGDYVTIGKFPQVGSSDTGTWMLSLEGGILGSTIRFEWTVSGTDATFSIGVVLKG